MREDRAFKRLALWRITPLTEQTLLCLHSPRCRRGCKRILSPSPLPKGNWLPNVHNACSVELDFFNGKINLSQINAPFKVAAISADINFKFISRRMLVDDGFDCFHPCGSSEKLQPSWWHLAESSARRSSPCIMEINLHGCAVMWRGFGSPAQKSSAGRGS